MVCRSLISKEVIQVDKAKCKGCFDTFLCISTRF